MLRKSRTHNSQPFEKVTRDLSLGYYAKACRCQPVSGDLQAAGGWQRCPCPSSQGTWGRARRGQSVTVATGLGGHRPAVHLRQAVQDLAARQALGEGLDGVLAVEEDDRIARLHSSWCHGQEHHSQPGQGATPMLSSPADSARSTGPRAFRLKSCR